MAYATVTLAGTYQTPDGTPHKGHVEIIPSERVIKDTTGDVILTGRVKVELDAQGAFSVALPATDDPTLNPTGFGYTIAAKLHSSHPPAVSFSLPASLGATTVEDLTVVDPTTFAPTTTYAESSEVAALDTRVTTVETDITTKADAADVPATPADLGAEPAGLSQTTNDALAATYGRRHAINVEDHGALGDWDGATGTDNLTAFNAAVTEAVANGRPTIIVIPEGRYWLSDGWLIDGETIEIAADPGAEIITTSPTTYGAAVTFMGNGVLTPNTLTTPQRESFAWRGGKITATGSAGADNALGMVRVKRAVVSDVILDADRKGLTAQYGVDGIWWERARVTRAGADAVTVETDCKRLTLRDITVENATGTGVLVTSGDAGLRCTDVLLDGIVVTNAGTSGVSVGLSNRVTIRKTHVAAAGTQGLYASETTGLSVSGDSVFPSINLGANVTFTSGQAVTPTLSGGWVAWGDPLAAPKAYRDEAGTVHLSGSVKSGTLTASTVIATLPVGYRPAKREVFAVVNAGANPPFAYLYIEPDGTIRPGVTLGSGTLLGFGGIVFTAA